MTKFDKSFRLNHKSEYQNVFDQANKLVGACFIVLYKKNSLTHSRLGLAIAKKAIAKAHDRNLIKRLIRETFRNCQLPGLDLVFMAKHQKKIDKNKLQENLKKIWNKLSEC